MECNSSRQPRQRGSIASEAKRAGLSGTLCCAASRTWALALASGALHPFEPGAGDIRRFLRSVPILPHSFSFQISQSCLQTPTGERPQRCSRGARDRRRRGSSDVWGGSMLGDYALAIASVTNWLRLSPRASTKRRNPAPLSSFTAFRICPAPRFPTQSLR